MIEVKIMPSRKVTNGEPVEPQCANVYVDEMPCATFHYGKIYQRKKLVLLGNFRRLAESEMHQIKTKLLSKTGVEVEEVCKPDILVTPTGEVVNER